MKNNRLEKFIHVEGLLGTEGPQNLNSKELIEFIKKKSSIKQHSLAIPDQRYAVFFQNLQDKIEMVFSSCHLEDAFDLFKANEDQLNHCVMLLANANQYLSALKPYLGNSHLSIFVEENEIHFFTLSEIMQTPPEHELQEIMKNFSKTLQKKSLASFEYHIALTEERNQLWIKICFSNPLVH